MDITRLLRGKTIAYIATNGHVLSIRCSDNSEINVAWVDDNGLPIMGKPVAQSRGGRLRADGIRDLIRVPELPANLHTKEAAWTSPAKR